MADVSDIYSIDIVKGHCPNHFNTRENQDYIGDIPSVNQFGIDNMSTDKYKDFETWYDSAKK